jgi:hypothetical protein
VGGQPLANPDLIYRSGDHRTNIGSLGRIISALRSSIRSTRRAGSQCTRWHSSGHPAPRQRRAERGRIIWAAAWPGRKRHMAEEDTLIYEQSSASARPICIGPSPAAPLFASGCVTRPPPAPQHLFVGWNDGYYTTSHFTELLPNRVVCFHLAGARRAGATRVHVAIGARPGRMRSAGAQWHRPRAGVGRQNGRFDRAWRRRWRGRLRGDQRRRPADTRRPMLGVLLAAFDAAAARWRAVAEVQLSGVVPSWGGGRWSGAGRRDREHQRPADACGDCGALQSPGRRHRRGVLSRRRGKLPWSVWPHHPPMPASAPELLARVAGATPATARARRRWTASATGASFRPGQRSGT